jgi:hypothetical protein
MDESDIDSEINISLYEVLEINESSDNDNMSEASSCGCIEICTCSGEINMISANIITKENKELFFEILDKIEDGDIKR